MRLRNTKDDNVDVVSLNVALGTRGDAARIRDRESESDKRRE